jgi:biopolymer transport protein TolQ
VAPGISEALIATAIGLAAAIPAAMGYNYFIGKFKKQDLELSNFNADFLNIVKRNFFKD